MDQGLPGILRYLHFQVDTQLDELQIFWDSWQAQGNQDFAYKRSALPTPEENLVGGITVLRTFLYTT